MSSRLCRYTSRGVVSLLFREQKRNESSLLVASVAILGFIPLAVAQSEEFPSPGRAKGLPIYRIDDVSKHTTKETGVWVTYKDGVYDITKFIANHPGGSDKIVLAAGRDIFSTSMSVMRSRQHYNSKLPFDLLAPMRIGTLHPDDVALQAAENKRDATDPYRNDPAISPVLRVIQNKPINAEPPATLLGDAFITPNDLWFVRNHHPVPQVDPNTYRLNVRINGLNKEASFTLEDLKTKFHQKKICSTIQCGGNRRQEMNSIRVTAGSPWSVSAISTAQWTGVALRDVLLACGLQDALEDELESGSWCHVQFESADGMAASIPTIKAMTKRGDVMLAYEMNGMPIPPEHGFPVRVVVPGHVGVRNVKWVTDIFVTNEEAAGPWQQGMAYKGFGPSTRTTDGIDVAKIPSLQEQPVQSAVTFPSPNQVLSTGPNTLKGYAYSGGGRGIVRVDVSIDSGKTWTAATLTEGSEQPLNRAWAWTLWECDVDIPPNTRAVDIVCKATDASYNVQPDSLDGVWNLRGINNNAWHRVHVEVQDDCVDE